MITFVGFDFDGVLARGSNEAYIDAYFNALKHVGIDMDRDLARKRILGSWGTSAKKQILELIPEHPELVDEALVFFDNARRSLAFRYQVSLFPGAEETIRRLSERYKLSIVSGAERPLIESVLGTELLQLFQCIRCASDVENMNQLKPSPYLLNQALNLASVEPSSAVYLGDAPNDLRMAIAADVTPIAILTGHLTRPQATELGARAIIEDIAELPETLSTLTVDG